MMLLRISTIAAALALAVPAHADDKSDVERPAHVRSDVGKRPPSKGVQKRSRKRQAPAAKSPARTTKPAAKPCEEVKPCAID